MHRRRFLTALLALAACSRPEALEAPESPGGTDDATTSTNGTEPADPSARGGEVNSPRLLTDRPAVAPVEAPIADVPADVFGLGVASGDPDADSVVLWTRLVGDGLADRIPVAWDVAADEDFGHVIASEVTTTDAADGHSLHIVVDGLGPDARLWYRFRVADQVSSTGRSRTLWAPNSRPAGVSIGVANCQLRESGWWSAHDDLATADIDIVLWLGDFIYSESSSVPPIPERAHRTADPASLASFRARYADYRADPALQASSAAHPWFTIWDDHEVRNDYSASVDSALRSSAYRAWWEHQPTRLARPVDGEPYPIHRAADLGNLVRLVLTDSRQYADGSTLYGEAQRRWLSSVLADPPGWTLLASSVLVGGIVVPLSDETLLPYTLDGYPDERQWLAGELARHPDRLCVSGDLHLGAALAVTADPSDLRAEPVAVEFMAPPISSGFPVEYEEYLPFIPLANGHIDYVEPVHGWLRLDIAESGATAEFRTFDVSRPDAAAEVAARFGVEPGAVGPRRLDA